MLRRPAGATGGFFKRFFTSIDDRNTVRPIPNRHWARQQHPKSCRRAHTSFSTSTSNRSYDDSKAKASEDQAYCVNLVRERDEEGYLCGLLMPAASRDAFFALRAFNVEVASIKDGHNLRKQGSSPPDQISTTSAMSSIFALQLRMQWWRNAIEAIFNEDNAQDGPANVVHHDIADNSSSQSTTTNAFVSNLATSCWNSPVVRALDRSNRNLQQRTNSGWTRRFLERLLDARETDLDIRQYESMDQCQQYADDTVSSLLYLTLETVQVRDDAADQAASHAGIGIGLTTLLRATPYRLLNGGEMPIPSQLLPSNFPYHQLLPTYLGGDTDRLNGDGSVDDIVLSESDSQNLLDAVRHMADTATDHLALARSLQSQVPSRGRCCLLPVIPSATYLSKLKQNEHNLFAAANSIGPTDRLSLLLRMARTWATGVL